MNCLDHTIVYVMDVKGLENKSLYLTCISAARELLPKWRREKIDAYRFDKDKLLSMGVGLLLRYACQEAGIGNADEDVVMSENGKTSFRACGGVHFNLSHSGQLAMCVISPYEVGCDVEQIAAFRESVAGYAFSEAEKAVLKNESDDEKRRRLFYRIWTLKESFVKCIGKGLGFPLPSFSVLTCGETSGHMREKTYDYMSEGSLPSEFSQIAPQLDFGDGKAFEFDSNDKYFFHESGISPDYCISCCIKNNEEAPVFRKVDMLDINSLKA